MSKKLKRRTKKSKAYLESVCCWEGIERKIFDHLFFNMDDEAFKNISLIYCTCLVVRGFAPKIPVLLDRKTRNEVMCNFFVKQSFFNTLPEDIKNYLLANSL